MGAGASSGVIAKSINEAAEAGNNVNQGSGSNAKSSSNKPAPIDTSNLTGAANDSKKRSASIVGKSTFRALLSLDEKELVVGRSPGSRLRKLAGTDEETPTRLAQLSGKQIKKLKRNCRKVWWPCKNATQNEHNIHIVVFKYNYGKCSYRDYNKMHVLCYSHPHSYGS